ADRNRSHWSTSKTPSYTKSVSWQHHPPIAKGVMFNNLILDIHITCSINKSPRILTRPLAQQSQAFILF
ncbi:hypothetical protein, partial [Escherichia coli]|uniref:hypothetical protein n=1 Tax=Escherichia coli TaxID=562 RepID=UPI001CDA6C16